MERGIIDSIANEEGAHVEDQEVLDSSTETFCTTVAEFSDCARSEVRKPRLRNVENFKEKSPKPGGYRGFSSGGP